MPKSHIISGIDVGNSYIKTVIAEINEETMRPQIMGTGISTSNGMRRGMIVDMEETINNIRNSVQQAETMAGVNIDRAYVSVNGTHIKTQYSHGVIVVSRADNEISQYDIDRVIDAASTVSLPPNHEIIHVIPQSFTIDGQEKVRNPLGMKGVRLEADVMLIEGLSPYIRNLAKCINANEIEVAEFVYAPLATAKAILDKHQQEHGVLCFDFGGGVSSIGIFYEGDLVHTAVLPIGSRHITNDIAIAFRTSMDKAEEIKKDFGFTGPSEALKKEHIDLSELLEEDDLIVPRKEIARIIDARISELFDLVTVELKKSNPNFMLPAGVVIAGGGAHLQGFVPSAKNRLRLSARIGSIASDYFLEGMAQDVNEPSFATAAGLIFWGFEKETSGKGPGILDGNFAKKVSKWLKNFLP